MITSSLAPEIQVPPSKAGPPDLWVLSVARSGAPLDVDSLFRMAGVSPAKSVLVTDEWLSFLRTPARHLLVPGAESDSVLWNAGLEHIRCQQSADAIWDVVLLDPRFPLSLTAINSLRHHMRMTDVWMAEPDLFGTLGHRPYRALFDTDPRDIQPPAAVVAGETGVRFDTRFFDDADSWAEYGRRVRIVGGSVRVSHTSLRERF